MANGMRQRRRAQLMNERLTAGDGRLILGERLIAFKRLYRWLNLTLVHQAVWPLLLLLTTAPAGEPQHTQMSWYLARAGAPAAAAILALFYLWERAGSLFARNLPPAETGHFDLRTQARFLLLGLPVMLTAVRLIDGPFEPVFCALMSCQRTRMARDSESWIACTNTLVVAGWNCRPGSMI